MVLIASLRTHPRYASQINRSRLHILHPTFRYPDNFQAPRRGICGRSHRIKQDLRPYPSSSACTEMHSRWTSRRGHVLMECRRYDSEVRKLVYVHTHFAFSSTFFFRFFKKSITTPRFRRYTFTPARYTEDEITRATRAGARSLSVNWER